MPLDFPLLSIEDNNVREALEVLKEVLNSFPFLKGKWQFIEYTVTSAVANQKIPHQLGFAPKDIILLSRTGLASVTFNNDSFNDKTIDITTTAATRIRMLVGTYREDN
jgi:hypothetical protein